MLRQPKTTGIVLIILLVVLLLRLIIPQQSLPNTTAEIWTANLPTWIQPWGELMFFLGLSQIGRSIWFWGPLAFLALSCLVALADFAPLCRQRAAEAPADIEWQHPLAQRAEHSVRLPASPDDFLDELGSTLEAKGFALEGPPEENQRAVSAHRGRWNWWAVLAIYGGLLLLCLAFLVSRYTLETEWLALPPFEPAESRLFAAEFELNEVDPGLMSGTFAYKNTETGLPQTFSWRLFQPTFIDDALVFPTGLEPVLTVEAIGSAEDPLRLLPQRPDLSVGTRLNYPLDEPEQPLVFSIRSASLVFQVLPTTVLDDGQINLQVARSGEEEPFINQTITVGDRVEIDNLSLSVSLNHTLRFVAWRDPALWLFSLSVIVLVVGGFLVIARPPWQVWLIPEVKGRGGQLYGVVEKLGFTQEDAVRFLDELLTNNEQPDAKTPPKTPLNNHS